MDVNRLLSEAGMRLREVILKVVLEHLRSNAEDLRNRAGNTSHAKEHRDKLNYAAEMVARAANEIEKGCPAPDSLTKVPL